ncbi:FimB/Mfa2 family fimbrial subunit [Parabacteroides gordonii]|uniref:FimB/Mfa2 family fimbrial subunit n=1 Tax=Parabacteroides gordonii TaxID=574930 RepID=UPI0026F00BC5|nr:FimB/Mfa2 family fimbrial subunit [Parabacteroides gordonii]
MKKGRIFTNCLYFVCTLVVVISFASCSADSDSSYSGIDEKVIENAAEKTDAPFSVVLKAYSDNKDITVKGDVDETTLFVFDENNDFYKQVTLDRTYLLQAKPVEISCPGSKQITVVAWAGLSSENEEISAMSQANIISDLQVSLKQNNGVAATLPGDLFYGQVTLKSASTKSSAETLKIERKVSSISLITKSVIKVLDSKEGNFYYKVKNTKSSFNHNGELTGEDIEYIIPATLNQKGNVVAENTTILPASNITVELYKDDKMILSSENVKNLEKVSVNEGELSELTFDLSRNSGNIVVTDWGTVIQHVTID